MGGQGGRGVRYIQRVAGTAPILTTLSTLLLNIRAIRLVCPGVVGSGVKSIFVVAVSRGVLSFLANVRTGHAGAALHGRTVFAGTFSGTYGSV